MLPLSGNITMLNITSVGFGRNPSPSPSTSAAKSQPPTSNTGALVTSLTRSYSLGWFSFSVVEDLINSSGSDHLDFFIQYWSAIASDIVTNFEGRGYCGYHNTYRSAKGLIIAYTSGRSDWYCSIPQTVINSIELEEFVKLMKVVKSLPSKVCRLDLALDDYSKSITKERLHHAYTNNDISSRSQKRRWVEESKGSRNGGFTLYIGSRQSDSYSRIYDKASESKGAFDCVRIELELKHEQAQAQADYLLSLPVNDWGQAILGIVKATFNFVDRSANTNISRCPLLDWWASLVSVAVAYRAPIPAPVFSVSSVLTWVSNSMGTTLSFLRQYFGDHMYLRLINSIENEDLNQKQQILLSEKLA